VAIELSSGRNAIGMSDGTRPHVGTSARGVMTDDRNPEPYAVAIKARAASVLFVRPGIGVWRQVIRDGGTSDGDGRANGSLVIDPASFANATDTSRPPDAFQDGDLLVTIEIMTREMNVVDIGVLFQQALGEAG